MESQPISMPAAQTQKDMFHPQHPLIEALEMIDPDNMTPKQAMDYLYQLKKTVTDN